MAEGVPGSQIIYTRTNTPVEHCSGPGHADKGFVCIYSLDPANVKTPPTISSAEGALPVEGTGRFGFNMEWVAVTSSPSDLGTYTVTAG